MSKFVTSVAAIAICLGVLSSTAQGAVSTTCSYQDSIFNGEVDFGSGNHSFGSPAAGGTVRWTFSLSSVSNTIVVTAQVQGTLYLDKIGAGCARLRINFQDNAGNNLQGTQTISFCGPGSNANSSANQDPVNVTSNANAQLRRVQLTLGAGDTMGEIIDLHTGSSSAPSTNLTFEDRINNGSTDFGFGPHSGGGPASDAFIDLVLNNNGAVSGRVNGILYWDDLFSGGTARIITDFKNSNGTTLRSRTDQITGIGGNANNAENKRLVDRRFTNDNLFRIRVRVGRVSNGDFTNVVSRNYSFGCNVGTVEGVPVDTTIRVGDDTTYGVQWTVPNPENWRSLKTLDVRLIDEEGAILQLRWDEATNMFSQLNTGNGRSRKSGLPGSQVRFHSPEVTVFLKNSEVIGSGPTGPSVLLNLNLQFKRRAAGRTFTVEARATNDSGIKQGWDAAGEITVLPRSDKNDDEDEDD
jgi:hypothetical protein